MIVWLSDLLGGGTSSSPQSVLRIGPVGNVGALMVLSTVTGDENRG